MNAENVEPQARLDVETKRRPLIRVANADGATLGLLREWLGAAGYGVLGERADETARPDQTVLVIVDVPFCRFGANDLLRRVSAQHPGTPILAISPTFFSSVRSDGACARRLGVAGVLPKPVACDALLAAVERLVHSAG